MVGGENGSQPITQGRHMVPRALEVLGKVARHPVEAAQIIRGMPRRQLANLLSEIFTPAAVANGLAEEGVPYDAGTSEPPKSSPNTPL